MASITMLRMNTISNEPMWRCSSRTEIAITTNESTAPPIHSAPRSELEVPVIGKSAYLRDARGARHAEVRWTITGADGEQESQARHLSAHLSARLLRADEEDRRGQS